MNVEIGAEAALFPEKEYIKGIFVAVHAEMEIEKGFGEWRRIYVLYECDWINVGML